MPRGIRPFLPPTRSGIEAGASDLCPAFWAKARAASNRREEVASKLGRTQTLKSNGERIPVAKVNLEAA